MTEEQKTGQTAPEQPKSRIEVVEEVLTTLVDKVEAIAKAVATIEKTAVKKSTQRFGAEHKPKAVKDTTTGKIYPSLFNAGKNLAPEFGLDPLNNQVWYQIAKKAAEGRFVILAADDPEAVAAQEAAKAELQKEVDAANKRADEEAKAKADEEAKAKAGAGSKGKGK